MRPVQRGRKIFPGWRFTGRIAGCAVLAATALAPGAAAAKEKATATVTARAVIVANLTFFKVDDLSFGRLVAGTSAGTVVVAPTGVRTATGGVRLASGGNVRPASFAGKGTYNQNVLISITSMSVPLNRVGGGDSMTVDTFIIGSTPTAQLTTAPVAFRISSTTGIFQFPVGATLRVKARQTPGTYAGTFAVTLQYQ